MALRRPRVVVTGPWNHADWDEPLRAAGCDVVVGPSIDDHPSRPISEQELAAMCAGADAVLVSSREQVTDVVLDVGSRLRIIAKATIGVERIDVAAASARGVLVVNSPAPENIIGVAEATVGLIVALAKRLLEKEARLRAGGWRDASTDGVVLAGRSIGLIGLGRVGAAVAQRLSGWGANLVAADPYIAETRFRQVGVQRSQLNELLTSADVITIHVPLTDETQGFIGEPQLASMRRGAFLINTSRGGVLDEAALVDALESGHLAGAALDVFEREPLPDDSPLRNVPRDALILTPHSLGSSRASRGTGTRMAISAILAALANEIPDHVVNPEVLPRWQKRWG